MAADTGAAGGAIRRDVGGAGVYAFLAIAQLPNAVCATHRAVQSFRAIEVKSVPDHSLSPFEAVAMRQFSPQGAIPAIRSAGFFCCGGAAIAIAPRMTVTPLGLPVRLVFRDADSAS